MSALNKAIAKEIENLKNNKIVRDFVEGQAYQQIAEDIKRLDPSRICSEAAARILVHRHDNKNILSRFDEYVAAGYAGVIMAKYNA